jgi:hypothetical protein
MVGSASVAIRDRNAVGVAREIGEHRPGAGKGTLGVDDPFGSAQRRESSVEGVPIHEAGELAEEG